jgi:DNA-directed RNA polymerase subunit beta
LKKRISFGKVKDAMSIPYLIEPQMKSFKKYLNVGIDEVLRGMFPISDHNGTHELQYVSSEMGIPKIRPEEAKRKNITYSAPLKAKFLLINHEVGDVVESEIFLGDFPYMTDQGTFIYNGVERVVVTQIVRSPGIYYSSKVDDKGKRKYEGQIIPSRGAWVFFDIDSKGVVNIRVDSGKKLPVTVFLKALGLGTNEEILDIFDQNIFIANTLDKDTTTSPEEAMIELFKKVRPNDPPVLERAKNYLQSTFFDNKKYDLAPVGRYQLNKKLSIGERATKKMVANAVDGFNAGTVINDEVLKALTTNEIVVETLEGKIVKVIGNDQTSNRCLEKNDFIAAVNYLVSMDFGIGSEDNIDHLGNRRLRLVGELLQNQFQIGMNRVEKLVRDKMNVHQNNAGVEEVITPQNLIHTRPLVAVMREFLGSGQLSQFVDQVNPLAELTNKRRISALGPGGIQKDHAGIEVRDVHYSHYGKQCPVETPEGFGVGLITSMAMFARVNDYGFLETPYCKVDRKTGLVTKEICYLTANDEEKYYIAQASDVAEGGKFHKDILTVRYGKEYPTINASEVEYADVSTKQIIGVAASLIPFLENDDAARAVMGANMMRQAVPLIKAEEPLIGTGIEKHVAQNTGASLIAEESGIVTEITTHSITVQYETIGEKIYSLNKFVRTNANTCFNHYVKVTKNQSVEKDDVLADSTTARNGELALGKNLLVAFMPWEGYNFEDAILLNERMVKEDGFTTITITEHTTDVRETKLGKEEITVEVPNTGEKQRKNLDEIGLVKPGTKVTGNDILVGKITPKSQEEMSAPERLLHAVFAEKSKEFRDSSLRMPNGKNGVVIDVVRLTKENAELPNGVLEQIKVYVAQKRKIIPGDKMAGRHGNKGVVSRILPQEDMPYLEDGTIVDVALNPLGVPSRMNIGQVMEVLLGMVAFKEGVKFEIPVFDGAKPEEIEQKLIEAGLPASGKHRLFDGRTGQSFENEVTVGVMYMLKLNHQVLDKNHARSTGPYSLVTQQPLGGKAQMGGQRFGEMEVWALEAHGAAYTLQEMMTLKSDDVFGRAELYKSILKNEAFPEPNIPESLKVLISEIRGLGMNIDAKDKDGNSVLNKMRRKPTID